LRVSSEAGYEVYSAGSIAETSLAQGSFDALVTDFDLGDGTGRQVIDTYHAEYPAETTKMVVLTGNPDGPDGKRREIIRETGATLVKKSGRISDIKTVVALIGTPDNLRKT